MGDQRADDALRASARRLDSHPYPLMVREVQKLSARKPARNAGKGRAWLPDAVVACVGGGSNAMECFMPFFWTPKFDLIGVEAGGRGYHHRRISGALMAASPGVLHGSFSYLMQDENGQVRSRIRFRPAWITARRRGAFVAHDPGRGLNMWRSATIAHWEAGRSCFRGPRALFRRSNRRMQLAEAVGARTEGCGTGVCCPICPGGETRTSTSTGEIFQGVGFE